MGAEAREAAVAARTVDRAPPRAEGGTRCRDAALQAKLDRLFLLSEQDDREAEDQRRKHDDRQPAHARPRNRRSSTAPAPSMSSSGMAKSGQVVALTSGL